MNKIEAIVEEKRKEIRTYRKRLFEIRKICQDHRIPVVDRCGKIEFIATEAIGDK